jgi:hypothetical protein
MSGNNSGQTEGPVRGESHRWVRIGALAAVVAAVAAAVGLFFLYTNQSSQVDVVLDPVGYTVRSISGGQLVIVRYTLTAVGSYPAGNVRINPICEAVIPTPEPVNQDGWKSLGDLVPGKPTTELCFISVNYTGAISGIKQSNTITWKNAAGSKKCSFTGRHIVVNDKQLDVMSPCT